MPTNILTHGVSASHFLKQGNYGILESWNNMEWNTVLSWASEKTLEYVLFRFNLRTLRPAILSLEHQTQKVLPAKIVNKLMGNN